MIFLKILLCVSDFFGKSVVIFGTIKKVENTCSETWIAYTVSKRKYDGFIYIEHLMKMKIDWFQIKLIVLNLKWTLTTENSYF